jgi:7-cyano-7-deazaguanine synthase
MPIPELMREMANPTKYIHPENILKALDIKTLESDTLSQNGLPYLIYFFGIAYAKYLQEHKAVSVKHIVCGVTPGDGVAVTSQTFTSLRVALLSMCAITAQYDWNFYSFFFEKQTRIWMTKPEIIKLAFSLRLPLELTWSCYYGGLIHCGHCLSCRARRHYFHLSKQKDPTRYASDVNNNPVKILWIYFKSIAKQFLRKQI